MTLLLTSDAVLRERQAGTLALAMPALGLLPSLPELRDERIAGITVEDLLRHRAGFDRLRSPDPMVIHATRPWCPGELAKLSLARLDFDPGTRHAYSNLNYCLLGVILERVTHTGFRELLEREYGLAARGIRFVDGPYFGDEVSYDFRNSEFYGEDYSRHFDFAALSSSAGLSGSASALAALLAELHRAGKGPLTHFDVEPDCDRGKLRGCYGYAVFPYQASDAYLRVHVQPGFLYAASSVAMLDDRGGVTVWVGNGMKRGDSATSDMTLLLYRALDAHYAAAH
jgi:D-alanyl-D-alanine carboxypeptidase